MRLFLQQENWVAEFSQPQNYTGHLHEHDIIEDGGLEHQKIIAWVTHVNKNCPISAGFFETLFEEIKDFNLYEAYDSDIDPICAFKCFPDPEEFERNMKSKVIEANKILKPLGLGVSLKSVAHWLVNENIDKEGVDAVEWIAAETINSMIFGEYSYMRGILGDSPLEVLQMAKGVKGFLLLEGETREEVLYMVRAEIFPDFDTSISELKKDPKFFEKNSLSRAEAKLFSIRTGKVKTLVEANSLEYVLTERVVEGEKVVTSLFFPLRKEEGFTIRICWVSPKENHSKSISLLVEKGNVERIIPLYDEYDESKGKIDWELAIDSARCHLDKKS